ncbi:mycothiol synthase [Frankia nepalensis]|uniref:mycothiol synthase n=1 Tax=Frankia nepalensis TaxID=1836974 RepID=UPI0027DB028C|nr:mycothiol synthase [Frankia nepalensis]
MTFPRWSDMLTAAEVGGIGALLAAARAADGVSPVSDDVSLTIRAGTAATPGRSHLLAADGDDENGVTGYAHLAHVAGGAWEADLVVHPDRRRRGVGAALVAALAQRVGQASGDGTLDVWAHGDTPAAAALAARAGFDRGRVLLQLRRPLVADGGEDGHGEPGGGGPGGGGPGDGGLPEPVWPAGVTVRAFEPGRDERAWLALNARAFASHPEQGRWTERDLLPREAEPWFDPAGFFLAERDGELIGFHWTKVHAEDPAPPDGDRRAAGPIGEVYVVGVDPARAGGGLGRALTLAGLRHLRDRGLTAVMLYTDEDNARAVRLYERLGFTRYAVDVQYRRRFAAR